MIMRNFAASVVVATALLILSVITPPAMGQTSGAPAADTVYVAPSTGAKDSDRASIITALEQAGPGDVVQFAPGTYLVGELIRMTRSRVTLLGHPDGTTLRGCAPEDFVDADVAVFACNGLELVGGHQTVRNLTFEYAWHGLFVGCCFPENMAEAEGGVSHRPDQPGGHLIENNTFRNSSNGLRVIGQSAETVIIRGNRFVNTFHALVINGGTAHVLGNDVSAPEPEQVPIARHAGGALIVVPTPPNEACGRNLIANNRVAGHTDGIIVTLFVPGTRCRGTVIRDNTIVTRELRYVTGWDGIRMGSSADSALHGVPIAITNVVDDVASDLPPGLRQEGASVLDSTIVEGNTIIGGSGLGIEVLRSSRNRIANNTISGITRRDPFPGNTVNSTDPEKSGWSSGNGAGIWISRGSDRNGVAGNRITGVPAHHVVLEGDENVVEGVNSAGAVLDLGTANRVVSGQQERVREADAGRLAEQVDLPRHVRRAARSWPDPEPHTARQLRAVEVVMPSSAPAVALIAAPVASPIAAAAQTLAITDVTVVDVREGVVRPSMTVLVSGARITAVGISGSVEVPGDARVVNGTGRYLIPGLWDMHAHSGGDELSRTIELPLYVAHGVTGIRELSGKPAHLQQRDEIARGELLGPRMVVGSPLVDGPNPWPVDEHLGQVRVPDAESARRTADSLRAEGYAFIKTYQFLSPEVYRALHDRANDVGMEVSGEIPMSVSLWEAAALGHRTVEHLTGVEIACSTREAELRAEYSRLVEEISADTTLKTHIPLWNRSEWESIASVDPEKCRALYRHLAGHGTWVVPTLVLQHQISHASDPAVRDDPRARYLPADWWDPEAGADWYDPERRLRPTYEHRMRALPQLHDAGVGILAGSDLPGGFPLHDELRLLVEAGLSPLDALRTATLNPARYLQATDSLGIVAPGMLADLVLLDANPLEDITNVARIRAVVLNGRFLDRAALDAMLRDVDAAARAVEQQAAVAPDESRFVEANGVRLHYLDFGGAGLPIVFVHSEAWDAHTYAEFAPRFANRNRVLAVTRPGYGESGAHPDGFDVGTQARSLIDFLDALGIERAVFAGNASATAELTFLGEHHADRVAGLIYFNGLAVPWLEEHDADPTRAFEMFMRASPGAGDVAERSRARKAYRPELLRADRPTIAVPALAFVARSGTMGHERGIGALALVGSPLMEDVRSQMPPSPVRDHLERLARDESYRDRQLEQIADPGARDYFLRLARDPELQERMYRYHEEVVLPALEAAQERFRRAFADELRIVRLGVDQIVGYEYRDAPHLIEPHIRRFLADLAGSSSDLGTPPGRAVPW